MHYFGVGMGKGKLYEKEELEEYDEELDSDVDNFEGSLDEDIEKDMEKELRKGMKKIKKDDTELLADTGYITLQKQISQLEQDLNKNDKELLKKEEDNKKTLNKINEEINEIKRQLLTPKKVDSMVDKRISDMNNTFIRLNQINSVLNKDKDFMFVTEHFKKLDSVAMTRKNFLVFNKKIDKMRREISYLDRLSREVEKNKNLENQLIQLNKRILFLEKRMENV